MNAQNKSSFWWRILSIALMVVVLSSAGCSSQQTIEPSEPSTDAGGQGIPQIVQPTGGMIAGTSEVLSQSIGTEGAVTISPACPKLDSVLNQVVASTDPISTAASLNLKMDDGKVQVNFLLADDDLSFLKDFGVEPGSQAGQEIQAFVPINQLCEIASLNNVLAVRTPAQAILP